MSSPPTQQINVADLDVPQLADVRRQLEEVRLPTLQSRVAYEHGCSLDPVHATAGAHPSSELVHAAATGAGQVPLVHRERGPGQARKQGCVFSHPSLRPRCSEQALMSLA